MGAWYGSKATTGLSQAIIALAPRHRVHIETHLGGGAIMKRKPPALRSIGIDLNARAIRTFRCGHEVELHRGCCHRFLAGFPFAGDELVCSDPPYVASTRKSPRRYRHDYDDGDHEALLDLLGGLPCSAMISGYPSALYGRLLRDWRSVSLQAMNQAGVATETIWFNFDPDKPHWHTCAGKNFTDRQRIKRNAASWARRCRAMPPGERPMALT